MKQNMRLPALCKALIQATQGWNGRPVVPGMFRRALHSYGAVFVDGFESKPGCDSPSPGRKGRLYLLAYCPVAGAAGTFAGPVGAIVGSIGSSLLSGLFGHHAKGLWEVPGQRGAGDIYPAMLSPGEAVLPVNLADRYRQESQRPSAGRIEDRPIQVNVTTGDINNLGGLEAFKSTVTRAVKAGLRTPATGAVGGVF